MIKECVHLVPKVLFWVILRWVLVLYHILHKQICQNAKYRAKTKVLKFGTEVAFFEYFWTEMLETIVIYEFSTLKFVKMQSFVRKQKSFEFGTEKFRVDILANYCHIFNFSPLEFLEIQSFCPKINNAVI